MFCSLEYIILTFDFFVIMFLLLASNGIAGSIPSEIGEMDNLEDINIGMMLFVQ